MKGVVAVVVVSTKMGNGVVGTGRSTGAKREERLAIVPLEGELRR